MAFLRLRGPWPISLCCMQSLCRLQQSRLYSGDRDAVKGYLVTVNPWAVCLLRLSRIWRSGIGFDPVGTIWQR
jgi:hypothetical protein